MRDYSVKNDKILTDHNYETKRSKTIPQRFLKSGHGNTERRFQHDVHRFPLTLASEETKQSYAKFMISVYWLYSVWVARNNQSSEETCYKQPPIATFKLSERYFCALARALLSLGLSAVRATPKQHNHICQSDSFFPIIKQFYLVSKNAFALTYLSFWWYIICEW